MKILVTGSSGFLGTALCQRLSTGGHEVTGISTRSGDLTTPSSLEGHREPIYDRIYHLAAWTRAGDFCLHHQGEQWLINQKINTNVLGWWAEYQPQATLVAVGTSCAYPPDRPLVETEYLNGRPTEDLFAYAMTKRMLYTGLIALRKQYGLNYLCATPGTLYGPGYHLDGRQMHFIFDLIRKIIRGKFNGDPVVLWGDGEQKREVLFIDDFVSALIELPKVTGNEMVNVGSGEEHPIRHFAKVICSSVGYDFANVQFDKTRYVGVRSKCLDVKKFGRLLPDFELTSLQDGLQITIAWAIANLR